VTPDFILQGVNVPQAITSAPGSSAPATVTTQNPLLPTVRIEDSAGTVLSEGLAQYCQYGWRVPVSFVPRDGRETLKVIVTWDTRELFGVVKGEREIVVESTDAGGSK
jgi:hypothetical protein